ncbi:MAG: DNA-3-methyladenine glycosylase [Candidatus Pacearchaeota archaeon]
MRLDKEFFMDRADIVAKKLLGKIIVRKIGNKFFKAKIVETEAYFGKEDPASRAVQNGDLRKTMEMGPGTILVYGVHNNWLMNLVTGPEGKAEAVLLRALEPLNFKKKCNGPGLLTRAMRINKAYHNKNIFNNKKIWIEDNKNQEKFEIAKSFRIGVRKDLPKKLRFYINNNPFISK